MVDWSVTAGKPEKLYTRHLLPKRVAHRGKQLSFEAAKRQAKEEITAFYNERVTKLTKMLDDANKLADKFADDQEHSPPSGRKPREKSMCLCGQYAPSRRTFVH